MAMTLHDFWMGCPRGQRITASLVPAAPRYSSSKCLPCLQASCGPASSRAVSEGDAQGRGRDVHDMISQLLENYHAHMRTSVLEKLRPPDHAVQVHEGDLRQVRHTPPPNITVVENGLDHSLFDKMA